MKARFALAASLALSVTATAGIVIEELPASLSLKQSVRLGNGSVLPAGFYDVKIEYRGWGNAATLHFFQNGVPKGNSPAEARGFPAQAPPVLTGPVENKKYEKADEAGAKLDSADAKMAKVEPGDAKIKVLDKYQPIDKSFVPPGTPQTFSWGAHGFASSVVGKTSSAPNGVKLSFDSTNSAAGFVATLPVVGRVR